MTLDSKLGGMEKSIVTKSSGARKKGILGSIEDAVEKFSGVKTRTYSQYVYLKRSSNMRQHRS